MPRPPRLTPSSRLLCGKEGGFFAHAGHPARHAPRRSRGLPHGGRCALQSENRTVAWNGCPVVEETGIRGILKEAVCWRSVALGLFSTRRMDRGREAEDGTSAAAFLRDTAAPIGTASGGGRIPLGKSAAWGILGEKRSVEPCRKRAQNIKGPCRSFERALNEGARLRPKAKKAARGRP